METVVILYVVNVVWFIQNQTTWKCFLVSHSIQLWRWCFLSHIMTGDERECFTPFCKLRDYILFLHLKHLSLASAMTMSQMLWNSGYHHRPYYSMKKDKKPSNLIWWKLCRKVVQGIYTIFCFLIVLYFLYQYGTYFVDTKHIAQNVLIAMMFFH